MLFTKREVLFAAVIWAKKFHRRWGRVEDRAADDNAGRGAIFYKVSKKSVNYLILAIYIDLLMVRVPPSPPYNPDTLDAGAKNPDYIRVFSHL